MNIKQLFPSPWLSPDDLQGKRVEVTISGFVLEELHNQRTNSKERKPVLAFEKAKKRLILNKTQAFAVAQIVGSYETGDWISKRIALRAGRAHNGKPTIIVEAASVQAPNEHLSDGGESAEVANVDTATAAESEA